MHNESQREKQTLQSTVSAQNKAWTLHTHTHTHLTSMLSLLYSPVDRPGVLVLEVLQVLEECGMKLVSCKRRQPPGEESALVTVLFNRETAALLTPAPSDIIHVHPPWWEDAMHDALKDPASPLLLLLLQLWLCGMICAQNPMSRPLSSFSV